MHLPILSVALPMVLSIMNIMLTAMFSQAATPYFFTKLWPAGIPGQSERANWL